jgi:hypothetical protein
MSDGLLHLLSLHIENGAFVAIPSVNDSGTRHGHPAITWYALHCHSEALSILPKDARKISQLCMHIYQAISTNMPA